jgi:hypothetical protein
MTHVQSVTVLGSTFVSTLETEIHSEGYVNDLLRPEGCPVVS